MAAESLGVTTKKEENFSDWYVEVVRKGEFIDQRTPVRGCDVFMPWGYAIWENIMHFADPLFKEHGVKNAYFPTLIPESLLTREAEHFEGFVPEVAWVTEAGDSKLGERLALRPTSETIMYYMYAQWIRSYKDLPLRINQWVNVFRWETKATRPFLRSREFLWQEGHTVHRTLEEADREVLDMIDVYRKVFEELLALPSIVLKRTESDKFAGALYTVAFEAFSKEAGRVIQIGTVHNLGQNFAKAFGIKFLDRDGKEKYGWQTSWGFSTRLIGAVIAVHGDNKGAVLPPRVAPVQVIVIPIIFKGKEKEIVEKAREIGKKLKEAGIRAEVDDRDDYTAGWKFNHWELKGVPLRIEIGPKDLENGGVTAARRDTGAREFIKEKDVVKRVKALLEEIQKDLFERAKKKMEESIVTVRTAEEARKAVENKKIARSFWCGDPECEERVKELTNGAEIRGTKFLEIEHAEGEKCLVCGREASHVVYIAKSY
ncbi:MAG: prolyl-tRNA synthetase [Candidatus Diapherotrites archaeon]|nr:prolyl-tRNA synthetase [Candidatus Diapherotrites archaeon]MDN5366843.1 prolyl-tRNA synthetase [Candidatus Diapherotrites archaeon]